MAINTLNDNEQGFEKKQPFSNDTEDMAYRKQLGETATTQGPARADLAQGSQYGNGAPRQGMNAPKRTEQPGTDTNRVDPAMARNNGPRGSQGQTVGMQDDLSALGGGNFASGQNGGMGDEGQDMQVRGAKVGAADENRVPEQVEGVTMGKRPQEHDVTEAQSQGQMYEKARTRQQ